MLGVARDAEVLADATGGALDDLPPELVRARFGSVWSAAPKQR